MDVEIMDILIFLAILVSPITAVYVGERLVNKRMKREIKDNVLKGIISNRHKLSSDDFLRDFNAIPVIFYEHERIKRLFRECYDSYQRKEKESVSKRKLNSVILAICDELDYKDITESDIDFIFTPKQ